MSTTEETVLKTCERCDRESRHVVESVAPDNTTHYLCWSCVSREEKRFNLKDSWKRERRTPSSSRS